MGRAFLPVLIVAVFLAPAAAAQTQDEILDQVSQLGDDGFFSSYPGLLVVKLSMASRLQSAIVPADERAAYASVVDVMETLVVLDDGITTPTYDEALGGLRQLLQLREDLATLTHASVTTFVPLLRLAIDVQIETLIGKADLLVATRPKTTERLDLLLEARNAAEVIKDPLHYSRLDTAYESLRSAYERDFADASARVDGGLRLSSRALPPFLSPEFPAHYAALLKAEEGANEAAQLYFRHGDEANMAVAQRIAVTLDDEAQRLANAIAIGVAADLLLVTLIAFVVARRMIRWSRDHQNSRLGDELALKV